MTLNFMTLASMCSLYFLTACGNCDAAAEEADAFVRQAKNQECATDDDCVVVGSNCSPMETTDCGQVAMSASAATSDEWKSIEEGLDACDQSCTVCLAQLIPSCDNGYCREPD